MHNLRTRSTYKGVWDCLTSTGVREKEKSTKVNTKVGFLKSEITVPGSSEMFYTWHLAHISRCFVLILYTAELYLSRLYFF